jgi:SAM-dependent methyltransferase
VLSDWVARLVAAWRRIARRPGGEALTLDEREELARAIVTLSRGLTRDRALAGARYLDDPSLLGAYLMLWWPVSYAQATSIFGELRGGVRGRVVDLGCGPGPLACAALDAGAAEVIALDRSARAIDALGAIARDEPRLRRRVVALDEGLPAEIEGADAVLLGHVLNELWSDDEQGIARRAALLDGILRRLAPGGRLVVIEPALRETSRALLGVRDRLVAGGAVVHAPCLYRGPCPALGRESDWCHAERAWEPPALVDELSGAARLHKEALKMTYLVLGAPGSGWPAPPSGRLFRVVSEPLDEKGRARRIGCGPEGRVALTLPTKRVSDATRAFLSLARGDVARLSGTLTARGDGLRLEEDATVEIVARAGEPVRSPE